MKLAKKQLNSMDVITILGKLQKMHQLRAIEEAHKNNKQFTS